MPSLGIPRNAGLFLRLAVGSRRRLLTRQSTPQAVGPRELAALRAALRKPIQRATLASGALFLLSILTGGYGVVTGGGLALSASVLAGAMAMALLALLLRHVQSTTKGLWRVRPPEAVLDALAHRATPRILYLRGFDAESVSAGQANDGRHAGVSVGADALFVRFLLDLGTVVTAVSAASWVDFVALETGQLQRVFGTSRRPVFVNLYGRSDWLARVRDLAARADAIVYHVYSSTPGLERERVLIREYGAKCVVYVRNGFQSGPRMAALSGAAVLRVYEMPETVHTRAVSGSGDFDEELSDLLDGSGQTRIGKLSRRRLASDVQAVMNAGA